jgi:hypothetical protein
LNVQTFVKEKTMKKQKKTTFKVSKERRDAVNAWREKNKKYIKAAAEEGITLTAYRKKHGIGKARKVSAKPKKASVLPKETVERIRKIKAGPAQPKANTGWSPEEEQRIAAIMGEAKCSRLTAIQKMKRENMAKKSTAAIPAMTSDVRHPELRQTPAPAAKAVVDPLAQATPITA